MEAKVKAKTFQDLINSEKLVMVDFHAEWCGPCKMMKPILEEVKSYFGSNVKIVKVDVDKNIQPASHYQVTGVPTLILFKEGKQVWRQSGVVAPSTLKQIIEGYQ
jgi:thioredoxin 1